MKAITVKLPLEYKWQEFMDIFIPEGMFRMGEFQPDDRLYTFVLKSSVTMPMFYELIDDILAANHHIVNIRWKEGDVTKIIKP